MEFTDAQIERYSRQIILPAIGARGQQRLLDTSVRVLGDGRLASTVALYLTTAGIGHLDLRLSQEALLPGQVTADLHTAQRELSALNPDTTVQMETLDETAAVFDRAEVIVCADVPIAMLRLVNRAAVRQRAPLIVAATGASARVALYAGHHAELPCAECD